MRNSNGRKPPFPFPGPRGLPGPRAVPVGQVQTPQHGGFDPRVKAAFEAQNREIQKIGEAFNTMRLFCIALVERLSPEEKQVVLSASRLNEIGEDMRKIGINVQNPAGSEDVTLTIVETAEEATMSVSMDKDAELVKNQPQEPLPEVVDGVVELPKMCTCSHNNHQHVAGEGRCKEKVDGALCACTGFTEQKYLA